LRVALVSCYVRLESTKNGTPRVNRNNVYKTGRIIPIDTIKNKVIFFGENPSETVILETPLHFSNTEIYNSEDFEADVNLLIDLLFISIFFFFEMND